MNELSSLLARFMARRSVSQASLADRTGVKKATISRALTRGAVDSSGALCDAATAAAAATRVS